MEPLSLVVGTSHPLAARTSPVGPSVLGQEPMALLGSQFALRRHVDLYALEQGLALRVVVESNSLGLIIQAVGQGRLVTVLPTTIAATQPRLRALAVAPDLPHYTIALVSAKGSYHSPACQAFMSLAAGWKFNNAALSGSGQPREGAKAASVRLTSAP
jgi:LysR family cyn operon transcriptional activator